MKRPFIVAIDGPAGAGKSTVSKILALRLHFTLVDTGAIYRCVALKARRANVTLTDEAALQKIVDGLSVSFEMTEEKNRVLLDGEDVSEEIRTSENSLAASRVSAQPVVRAALLGLQRKLALAAEEGAILEGRDIGTVVFPDARWKFFMTANPQTRAKRRVLELKAAGMEASEEEILRNLLDRDETDSNRAHSPLRKADGAVEIDTSGLTMDEQVATITSLVRRDLATP